VCIYCIARGVVIFCVVNMILTCEWMNEIDMLCFQVIGSYTSGISSTSVRNSVFSRVERSGTSGKTLNFSHEWKKSQIFNKDEYKYLFLPFQLESKACRFHSFIRMSISCLLHKILDTYQNSSLVLSDSQSLVFCVVCYTKLPNYEQSYKGKVKTHKYINRQNQSTTGKLWKHSWSFCTFPLVILPPLELRTLPKFIPGFKGGSWFSISSFPCSVMSTMFGIIVFFFGYCIVCHSVENIVFLV
jgi:hypothetical protein